MISSVGSMNSYMPAMRPSPAGQSGQGDGFQMVDTDASGGVSSSELESFASTIQEVTGSTVDTETTMETYDLDGDEQLSGEELFALVSEYGLRPSAPGTAEGDWVSSDDGGGMMPPPPPPPSFSIQEGSSAYETIASSETDAGNETSISEELYAQLLEKLTGAYGGGEAAGGGGVEFLLNEMA